MKTVKEKDWTIKYYNKWEAEFECRMPPIIFTEWIYTDKDLEVFQKWFDKKGKL